MTDDPFLEQLQARLDRAFDLARKHYIPHDLVLDYIEKLGELADLPADLVEKAKQVDRHTVRRSANRIAAFYLTLYGLPDYQIKLGVMYLRAQLEQKLRSLTK